MTYGFREAQQPECKRSGSLEETFQVQFYLILSNPGSKPKVLGSSLSDSSTSTICFRTFAGVGLADMFHSRFGLIFQK